MDHCFFKGFDVVYNRNVYYIPLDIMAYTLIPSVKGQITIPPEIRKKYSINKETPIVAEDSGKGVITLKVMKMVGPDEVSYYETAKEFGLAFKKGIDPKKMADAIKKIDG